jgi:hypothetical protein
MRKRLQLVCIPIIVRIAICAGACSSSAQTPIAVPITPAEGSYTIRLDKPAQVIWGLGYEIQSDSIG